MSKTQKYVTRMFPKETLQEVLWEDAEGFEIIENEIYDTSRWSTWHNLIFKHEDKFYETQYSQGATESQDEIPWEYDGPEIECYLVEPKEVTTIKYVNVKL
jgi:hypothetical protein